MVEKDKKFDVLIRYRFLNIYYDAINRKLKSWRISEKGRLAEIILIEQFSRNLFRDKPDAYYHDCLAIFLSKKLIHLKPHQKLNKNEKIFTFMPFMHSEIFDD